MTAIGDRFLCLVSSSSSSLCVFPSFFRKSISSEEISSNGNHGGENTYYPIYNCLGGDRDDYGCIGSPGYLWCHSLLKCIRPWEKTFPGGGGHNVIPGGDVDIHGC